GIDETDFSNAVDRVIAGLEKKNKIISPKEKKVIAYHEAGHAVVSWLVEHASPLVKVSVVPRGETLGAAWYLPEERQITTTPQIEDELCAALGGRAAEEMIFGQISTGALNDLEKVTKQAYAMVSVYGLSEKIGNRSYYDPNGQEYQFTKPYSDKTAREIDEEAGRIIEETYERAKKIIKENRERLSELAEKLLDEEVIFKEDLEKAFGKKNGSDDAEGKDKASEDTNGKTENGQESKEERSVPEEPPPSSSTE
ncbi:MAG: peptidase M41, partial [Flavobacteriales bacterium]